MGWGNDGRGDGIEKVWFGGDPIVSPSLDPWSDSLGLLEGNGSALGRFPSPLPISGGLMGSSLVSSTNILQPREREGCEKKIRSGQGGGAIGRGGREEAEDGKRKSRNRKRKRRSHSRTPWFSHLPAESAAPLALAASTPQISQPGFFSPKLWMDGDGGGCEEKEDGMGH